MDDLKTIKMDGSDDDHPMSKGQDGILTNQHDRRSPENDVLLKKNKLVTSSEKPFNKSTSQHTNKYVDHGWAWMIMFGCSLMHFLVGGFARSYSLIYMYLQEHFDSSAALTAWVGGTSSAMRMLTSPVATALSARYSARTIVMIGGVLCGFGGILSAFAPSTEYMFFSYSFFEGLGGALVYAPGIVIVGQYFDRYRSIAMGLSTAGSGLGVFCFPPLMQLLFSEYGFFGAMLITGALMFNNIISGAVYRPLPPVDQDRTPQDKGNNAEPDHLGSEEKQGKLDETTDDEVIRGTIGDSNPDCEDDSIHCKRAKKHCFSISRLNRYLDLRLFRNPTFVMYVLSLGFITLSYISGQMLVAAYAHSRGVSYENSVWLISVIGICDMIGRATSGFLFNASIVRHHRRHYYDAAILLSGITHFMIAGSERYIMFIVVCCIHGLFTGVVVSQRAVICTDLMGVENLSSSFGLTIFVQGAGILIGPVTAGFIKDLTGSYLYSFIFTGICSMIAAIFLFAEWLIISRRGKDEKQKAEMEKTDFNMPLVDVVVPEKIVLKSDGLADGIKDDGHQNV